MESNFKSLIYVLVTYITKVLVLVLYIVHVSEFLIFVTKVLVNIIVGPNYP